MKIKKSKAIKSFLKFMSLICICFSLIATTIPVYAGTDPGSGSSSSATPTMDLDKDITDDVNISGSAGALGTVANIVVKIFTAVGVMLLIYGIALFVMAHRNDNPEERHKAIMVVVVGIIFLGMRTIAINVIEKTFQAAGYGKFIK